jgi:hypothetical protein
MYSAVSGDMRCVTAFLCLLAATACSSNGPLTPAPPIDREVVVQVETSVSVPEASATITFDRVVGDSRCPADALCVLGGDAVVRIEVTSPAGRSGYELHTGNQRPVTHHDLTIHLVQLEPYPFSAHPIDPRTYRATLRVVR